MIKASELSMREVINVADGRKLGPIKDVELDPSTGTVRTLIISGDGREGWFFSRAGRSENDYVLPWQHVKKIGVDVILVELGDVTNKHRLPVTGLD